MKRFILSTLFFLSFLSLSISGFAQVGVSGYSTFALGINTNTDYRLGSEVKLWTNYEIEESSVEVNLLYNFKARKYHQFSIGAGVQFIPLADVDPINALVFPAALEIFPLNNTKKFSLRLELAAMYESEDVLWLRHMLGIRYTFGKNE